MNENRHQTWGTMWDAEPEQMAKDPQSKWTIVYPVFLRKILQNSEERYTDTLVHVASSLENAKDWCGRNTDYESRNDEKHWWWFVIMQEAIDGDFSGIRGVMEMLDWDGKSIVSQPFDGYAAVEKSEEVKE